MKKADIVLLGILLIAGFIGIMTYLLAGKTASYVSVTVDGELIGTYDLNVEQEVLIESADDGENILRISDGRARMILANCPNQDCVKHKEISQSNESIVCLPHKVVVTVLSDNGESCVDAVVY